MEDSSETLIREAKLSLQAGDVPATWANMTLLKHLTGYCPETNFKEGIEKFVLWFREYYGR